MIVKWRPAAETDLDVIFEFLEANNLRLAYRFAESLSKAALSLATFPHRGRPGRKPGTRELIVVRLYVIVYKVGEAEGTVLILRIFHDRQNR
jgi:addiction module RelE/StbE family toxin